VQLVHLDLRRRLPKTAPRSETGVVDQQIEPGLGGQPRRNGVEVGSVGQIGDQDFGGGGQFGGEALEPILAAGNQQQVLTLAGQAPGIGRANAAGSAGNCG
jgi:hypothetical protein